jgi:hypothetical protein
MSIARLKKAIAGFSLLLLSGYITLSLAVDISGNWHGIVTCDGYVRNLILKLSKKSHSSLLNL